jgi:hypothetical protein
VVVLALMTSAAIPQVDARQRRKNQTRSETQQAQPASATPSSAAVTGGGTAGQIVKFAGDGSATANSIVTETKTGNIGIGTTTPGSKLSVQGMIETTLGGYKFPDGTIQTSAFPGRVFHNETLAGDGTGSSPLGLAPLRTDATLQGAATDASPLGIRVPLLLNGAVTVQGLIRAEPSTDTAIEAKGGDGNVNTRNGSTGVSARGGNSEIRFGSGGTGVDAFGGAVTGESGFGGTGLNATGGDAEGGGFGIIANGGNSKGANGGTGLSVSGGISDTGFGGNGAVVTGGFSRQNRGGIGLEVFGGSGDDGDGGTGIEITGGAGSGSNHISGRGLVVRPGTPFKGAERGLAADLIGDVQVEGNLRVTRDINLIGNLTKGGGSFKIDHPLDPENKYLYHSFVESPDMMNIYNGTVTTDSNGNAAVTLPEWFEALNQDFRYQLTVIATFAQAIVSREIKDNRFFVKTSKPNVKVCWQVTGVRHDAYANKHRIAVEEQKPKQERGSFLYPDAFIKPQGKGVRSAAGAGSNE